VKKAATIVMTNNDKNVFQTSNCKFYRYILYLSGPEVSEEKEDECNRFTPQEVKEAIFREHSLLSLPENRNNSSCNVDSDALNSYPDPGSRPEKNYR
jgi:hypothetical protein